MHDRKNPLPNNKVIFVILKGTRIDFVQGPVALTKSPKFRKQQEK